MLKHLSEWKRERKISIERRIVRKFLSRRKKSKKGEREKENQRERKRIRERERE